MYPYAVPYPFYYWPLPTLPVLPLESYRLQQVRSLAYYLDVRAHEALAAAQRDPRSQTLAGQRLVEALGRFASRTTLFRYRLDDYPILAVNIYREASFLEQFAQEAENRLRSVGVGPTLYAAWSEARRTLSDLEQALAGYSIDVTPAPRPWDWDVGPYGSYGRYAPPDNPSGPLPAVAVQPAGMRVVDVRVADLRTADLRRADLRTADFRTADLNAGVRVRNAANADSTLTDEQRQALQSLATDLRTRTNRTHWRIEARRNYRYDTPMAQQVHRFNVKAQALLQELKAGTMTPEQLQVVIDQMRTEALQILQALRESNEYPEVMTDWSQATQDLEQMSVLSAGR